MTQLLTLLALSTALVLTLERFAEGRKLLNHLSANSTQGTCRSFILDIFLLLPLVGLLVEVLSRRIKSRVVVAFFPLVIALILTPIGINIQNTLFVACGFLFFALFFTTTFTDAPRVVLYLTALGMFLTVSISLYADLLNMNFLAPYLSHPKAWGGNHFMWNSGIEVLGLRPLVDTTARSYGTYRPHWDTLAIILFATYPCVMIYAGRRLHGLLFGYTEKQTGISALFWEPRKHEKETR